MRTILKRDTLQITIEAKPLAELTNPPKQEYYIKSPEKVQIVLDAPEEDIVMTLNVNGNLVDKYCFSCAVTLVDEKLTIKSEVEVFLLNHFLV